MTTAPAENREPVESEQFATVRVSELRVGATLRAPIYDPRDDRNLLLLASGATITEGLLNRLVQRGITHVRVHREELMRLLKSGPWGSARATARKRSAARRKGRGRGRRGTTSAMRRGKSRGRTLIRVDDEWAISPDSFIHHVTRHGDRCYQRATAVRFVQDIESSLGQVEDMYQLLAQGGPPDVDAAKAVTTDALLKIVEDLDLFVALGIRPAADKYPFRHAIQTSMLALAIGTTMGLRESDLVDLGIGCLLHDAGMLLLERPLYEQPRVLEENEFFEITRHSSLIYEKIRSIARVPSAAKMVAYQMHERCNGSGYPRHRRRTQIHPFARIAAVADVYLALISPRPYRLGILPYDALELVLDHAGRGLLDPKAVRGLLHTISLFPVGSFVEMTDGRVGRVIRSNGADYASPVVLIRHPHEPPSASVIVDLSQETDLKVRRPLSALPEPGAGNQPHADSPGEVAAGHADTASLPT